MAGQNPIVRKSIVLWAEMAIGLLWGIPGLRDPGQPVVSLDSPAALCLATPRKYVSMIKNLPVSMANLSSQWNAYFNAL
jgi:hypothetical protein